MDPQKIERKKRLVTRLEARLARLQDAKTVDAETFNLLMSMPHEKMAKLIEEPEKNVKGKKYSEAIHQEMIRRTKVALEQARQGLREDREA